MALSKSLPPRIRKVPVLGCNDLATCSQAPGQERPGCHLLPGPLCAPLDHQKQVGKFPGGVLRKQGPAGRLQWERCPSPPPRYQYVPGHGQPAGWSLPPPNKGCPVNQAASWGRGGRPHGATTRKGLWWEVQRSWKGQENQGAQHSHFLEVEAWRQRQGYGHGRDRERCSL